MVLKRLARYASLACLLGALGIAGAQGAYNNLSCVERSFARSSYIQENFMKPHERAVVGLAERTNYNHAAGLAGLAGLLYVAGRKRRK